MIELNRTWTIHYVKFSIFVFEKIFVFAFIKYKIHI